MGFCSNDNTVIIITACVIYMFRPPQLVFVDGNVYDFGRIDEYETISKEFLITNNGGKALIVKAVKKSCGCTKAAVDKKKLKRGDTAKLKVTYQARPLRQKEKVRFCWSRMTPEGHIQSLLFKGSSSPEYSGIHSLYLL